MVGDNKIRYLKLARNSDHLAALKYGASRASSDWIVLLDADDELTPDSIQVRLAAAQEYKMATGVIPQLVYGDLASVSGRPPGYAGVAVAV
jgi:glycosyltransferase involved in cell wall biosynthesis